jgi:hypothetical protein
MPPQQRQRFVDVVGGRLNFGAHGSLRLALGFLVIPAKSDAKAGIQGHSLVRRAWTPAFAG